MGQMPFLLRSYGPPVSCLGFRWVNHKNPSFQESPYKAIYWGQLGYKEQNRANDKSRNQQMTAAQ